MDKRWQAYLLSVIGSALITIGNALAQAAGVLQAEAQAQGNASGDDHLGRWADDGGPS